MKRLAARLTALIGFVGLAGLAFLLFVSYQGALSVAILSQVELLARIGETSSLSGSEHFATVAIDGRSVGVLHGTVPPEVLDRISMGSEAADRWMDVDGRRFVWAVVGDEDDAKTALVYETDPASASSYLNYMMLPLAVAALIVVWVSVWAGLYLARLIRAVQRQSALEASLSEAVENRRLRDSFLAHLSHELRTPLNAIIGFSQVLASETFGPLGGSRNVEYAHNIHRSGLHLVRLVGNILDHSRIELGKDKVFESEFGVEGAVGEAVSILSAEAEQKKVAVSVDVPQDLPRLNADRMKTMQVLINLLSNALKFSADGAAVTVTARVVSDGTMEIEVADTGIGMSPADMRIVQKPFGRVTSNPHHSKDGTGLGLSLSTSLMGLQGSTLTLSSELGRGTRAVAAFPASRLRPGKAVSRS